MKGLKNKSRKLLMLIIACVMMLSVITVSTTVYNNYSKADVLKENVVDTDVVYDYESDEEVDDVSDAYDDLYDEEYNVTDEVAQDVDTNDKNSADVVEADEDINDEDINDEVAADIEDQELNYIDPKEVRFMQSSIKNKTGEHTVIDNVEALKKGILKPTDMPLIRLWKDDDGNIWTLDHRRLAAFRLAGLDSVPFEWATEEEVEKQMWKMTTTTEGKTIRLKLGNGKNYIVK